MKKALLISGGRQVSKELIEKYLDRFIIIADGGARLLMKYGLGADILLGDLDSIGEEALTYIKEHEIEVKKFPAKKDFTDTELALSYLVDEEYKDIVILGALGTRLDHELANLMNLKKLYKKGIMAKIEDDYNEVIYVEEGSYDFEKINKKYFSLINAGTSMNFTTKGLYYEVEELEINSENPSRGVSNEMVGEKATIKINAGSAFIIQSRD
ncbi:MAG: thiamine diphosphokinase [Peptoniphilus harei]|uniref:thiamine diphosphokinase n=1 Tax=Peptoniphilus harei TaxID=54005 RepID=UPI00290C40B5|nr:thiamine diphosphokinase [Peptoniphilus harei]MDU5470658.1 thiamine diphosphokinase [Peptoniphilus harei]MDU6098653.1 thiamine diphosphokinase [Peptoniphilus harei]